MYFQLIALAIHHKASLLEIMFLVMGKSYSVEILGSSSYVDFPLVKGCGSKEIQ